MASDLHPSTEQSTTSLISGIIDDFERLVKQQMALVRTEIATDMRKATDAALSLAAGAAVSFLSAVAMFFALVHLIHWASSPQGADPAWIPLWGCFGLVGAALALVGAILLLTAAMKLKSIKPLENPATQGLKENITWATHPTK